MATSDGANSVLGGCSESRFEEIGWGRRGYSWKIAPRPIGLWSCRWPTSGSNLDLQAISPIRVCSCVPSNRWAPTSVAEPLVRRRLRAATPALNGVNWWLLVSLSEFEAPLPCAAIC